MPKIPNPQSELLREPNLLIPGKKPVGPVKIDWSHPYTDKLKGFWLLPNLFNYVNYKRATVSGSPVFHGDRITFNTANSDELQCGSIDFEGTFVDADITMFVLYSHSFTGASQTVVKYQISTNYASVGQVWSTTPRVTITDQAQTGVSASGKRTVALRFSDVTDQLEMYQDGSSVGSRSTVKHLGPGGDVYIGSGNAATYFTGDIYSVTIINKYLSSEAIADISNDPYQFLIPA